MRAVSPLVKESKRSIQGQSPYDNVSNYTDNVLSSIGFGLFQVIAFILAELTCLAYNCEALTFSFISIKVTNRWNINNLAYASLPAATSIANVIGEIIVGYFADKYGRKWPYVASLFTVAVFLLASAFANSFAVFGVLRGIACIGIGGLLLLKIPMLMEFLPVKHRGVVATSTGLLEGFVKCAVAGTAWWLVPRYSNGWRYFIVISSVPSFIIALFFIFYVESPRYLITHNQSEKAWKIFSLVARVNGKNLNDIVQKEEFLYNMEQLCKRKSAEPGVETLSHVRKLAVIFNRTFIRRTLCFTIILSVPIAVAYNTTLFLPNFLTSLELNPYLITFIGLASEIPGRVLIPIIVEWPEFGRRNTIRMFFLLSVIFYLLFAFVQNEIATPVFIVLVYFSLVPTSGLLTTYMSESYPTEIRIMALAFLSIVSGLTGAWFPFVSGYATDLSTRYSWVSPTYLAAVMMVTFVVAMLLKHETRGQNLEDIIPEQSSKQ